MDITELYNKIIESLNKSGNSDITKDLADLLASSATGSEALALTGKYFFDLKQSNYAIYDTIKDLVVDYIKYCRINGIIIK